MSDPNKSDSDQFVPPGPAGEPPAKNAVPAWLDGLDVPDGAPAPRPDSWPDLIPLTTTPAKPPAAAPPVQSAPEPTWGEPDSWPDVPLSPAPKKGAPPDASPNTAAPAATSATARADAAAPAPPSAPPR